jgi:hypothetical protein
MQDFAHHQFRLVPDFFNQHFLRAHDLTIPENVFLASRIAQSPMPPPRAFIT